MQNSQGVARFRCQGERGCRHVQQRSNAVMCLYLLCHKKLRSEFQVSESL